MIAGNLEKSNKSLWPRIFFDYDLQFQNISFLQTCKIFSLKVLTITDLKLL